MMFFIIAILYDIRLKHGFEYKYKSIANLLEI